MMISAGLSVVIPLFNKEHTIQRALHSVSKQDLLPDEVIVVDDGSTDKSAEIVKQFDCQSELKIRYIYQSNRGVSAARNKGAAGAAGKFIAFLDADDEWLPHHTINLKNLISGEPKANLYTNTYTLVVDGKQRAPKADLPDSYSGIVENFISVYSRGYGLIHSSSVCFEKTFFNEIGGFPEGEISGEDIYVWLNSALNGQIACNHCRSVVVHKTDLLSGERREKSIPYHIQYFSDNLRKYNADQQKELKRFLKKNIMLHWAAAKVEKNKWFRKKIRRIGKKISTPLVVLLLLSEMVPGKLFKTLKSSR